MKTKNFHLSTKTILFVFLFVAPMLVEASDVGHYHVSSSDKNAIKNDIDQNIINKISSAVWADENGNADTEDVTRYGFVSTVRELKLMGVISKAQEDKLNNYNATAQAAHEAELERKQNCLSCAPGIAGTSCRSQFPPPCDIQFDALNGGDTSLEVFQSIESGRRSEYARFLRDKILGMVQTAPKGQAEEVCNYRACSSSLTCAADPNNPQGRQTCQQHSECPSNVCSENVSSNGNRFCEPVARCYPELNLGDSCEENPVCGGDSQCQSTTDDAGESMQCLACSGAGEPESDHGVCCSGLVAMENGVCLQAIPEDITYDSKLGFEETDKAVDRRNYFVEKSSNFDREKCEVDWYQSYLSRLEQYPEAFERDMALLAFEFMAGGEDIVEDYWSVNQTLRNLTLRKRYMRRWLFKVLKAGTDEQLTVLENVRSEMAAEPLISEGMKSSLDAQFREIVAVKNGYRLSCDELNVDIEAKGRGEGVQADGIRALQLAKYSNMMEQKFARLDYNVNISPSFQEIHSISREMVSKDWKHAEREYRSVRWKERKNWFEIATDFTVNQFKGQFLLDLDAATDVLDDTKDIVNNDVTGDGDSIGNQLGAGVYSTLWGGEPPTVKRKELSCSVKLSGIYCKYRLDIYWPKSSCDSSTTVLATSGACLKRFSFVDFRGKPDILVDPFVPIGMGQGFFFKKDGQMQEDFVPLVNQAAENSISYLLGRKKPGLNMTAIKKAFPGVGKGRHTITEEMKDEIKAKAIAYMEQEYPDLNIKDEYKKRWADYAINLHYLFPKLSKNRFDIGYPQRGLVSYLTLLKSMLGDVVEEGNFQDGDFERRTEKYDDLLAQMFETYGLGTEMSARDRLAQANPVNINDLTGDSSTVEGSSVVAGETAAVNSDLFGNSGGQENDTGSGTNDGLLDGGEGIAGDDGESSAIAKAFKENQKRNKEIIDSSKERSNKLREQLRAKGEDPSVIDEDFQKTLASFSAPSLGGGSGSAPLQGLSESTSDKNEKEKSSGSKNSDAQSSDQFIGSKASNFANLSNTKSSRRSKNRPKSMNKLQAGSKQDESQKKIEQVLDSMSNAENFSSKENDSLFEKITKAYIRNYARLLDKRTKELE